jgi:hypothetical protein
MAAARIIAGLFLSAFLWSQANYNWNAAQAFADYASVAVAHAVADGRASGEGYPELEDQYQSQSDDDNPELSPVPEEHAETAVAADGILATSVLTAASEREENGRWLAGGFGVVSLATLRYAFSDGQRWYQMYMRRRNSPSARAPRVEEE